MDHNGTTIDLGSKALRGVRIDDMLMRDASDLSVMRSVTYAHYPPLTWTPW